MCLLFILFGTMKVSTLKNHCNGFIIITMIAFIIGCTRAGGQTVYQLKIYHLSNHSQEARIHQFLEEAFIPALHRIGKPKIGVFKAIQPDTVPSPIYVLIPFTSFDELQHLEEKLLADNSFLKHGRDYLDAAHDNPTYDRIESIIISAFEGMPDPHFPVHGGPKADHVYELRSYEGPTERYYRQKVKMFNDGDEISLFNRLGFNAVFYGEVIAGNRMPNLMYMTSFINMADRDERWERFNADSQWLDLKAMEEYKNSVSKVDIYLLQPLEYSDY